MRRDLIVALYFFFLLIMALLLTQPYLLAVMRLERIINGQDCDSQCLMNDDLPILLIKKRKFNGNLLIYFTSFRLGTQFPTKIRIFLLWVMYYEIVLVKRTS